MRVVAQFFSVALTALLSVAIICSCVDAEPKPALRIGALLHLTGEMAVQGQAFREGIELAQDEIRLRHGNHFLKVYLEDTEYKPSQALTALQRLVLAEVDAVLISTATETKAVSAMLHREKIPAVVLWDSSPELEALGEQIFAIGPWTPASGEQTADFSFESIKAKTAFVVDTETEWSQSVSGYFIKRFEALGGNVIHRSTTLPSDQDFRSIFFKMKQLKPDVLFAPVDGSIPQFFRQRRQLGLSLPTVTVDIITQDYLTQDAQIYEGIYMAQSVPPEGEPAEALQERYQLKHGKRSDQLQFVAWGYDGTLLLAEAAHARAPQASLTSSLHTGKPYVGISGVISFAERRSAPHKVSMYAVQNGRFINVRLP